MNFLFIKLFIHCWVSLCCCLLSPLLSSFLLISSLFFSYPISSYHAPGRLLNFAPFSFPISSLFALPNLLLFISIFIFSPYLVSSVTALASAQDMCAILEAYWSLSAKRFIDNLCMVVDKDILGTSSEYWFICIIFIWRC